MTSILKNNTISLTKSKKERMLETTIPTFYSYNNMLSNKYSIKDLKYICKYYKIKTSGNKSELTSRIYDYLHTTHSAIKIQRYWRKYLCLQYDKTHGPARKNRKLCINETDFYSMEPIEGISYNQFYSFKDVDNMIYGFDILSLYNLLLKGGQDTTNPYNRNPFPQTVRIDIDKLIKLSKMVGDEINITIEESEKMCLLKELELKSLSLFLDMDDLGNYTDPIWFWALEHNQIIHFLKELSDIWIYRAQLTQQIKNEICPPVGDPFRGIHINYLNNMNLTEVRKVAISIIESFIKRGINSPSRSLGANFVLCALTLVNTDAANALPWLFQSVSHI